MPAPNHDVAASIFYAGSYHEIHGEVHMETGITVSRGYATEGAIRPQKISMQLISDDDRYRPANPEGLLYGVGGQNMPVAMAADGVLLAVCEASEMQPGQTLDFSTVPFRGRRWVDITAEDVLRRIGQWEDPVQSPMSLQITGYSSNGTNPTLRGYWPLEDPSGATTLTNMDPAGRPGFFSGDVDLGAGTPPAGSAPSARLNTGGRIGGPFRGASYTAGWQFCFATNAASLPPDTTERVVMSWTCNNGYRWEWMSSDTTYRVNVYDGAGTLKATGATTHGTGASPDRPITFRIKASLSGGTTSVEVGWYVQDSSFFYGFSTSYVGPVGALTGWEALGNTTNNGWTYGHVFGVWSTTDDLQSYEATTAFDAYINEKAGDRFDRLCALYNIARVYQGTRSATMPMGYQPRDTLYNLLKECAATDDAMIFGRRNTNGLTFRTRRNLQGQTVQLALTYPDHIAQPFDETYDDAGVRNRVTVSQRNGSDYSTELTSGPMSSATSPPGIGPYRGKQDVNVSSELHYLPTLGDWWLNRGTVPMPRYPQVTIDTDANPSLAVAVSNIDPGDIISIDGHAADQIRLMVIGIEDDVRTYRRKTTLTCVPAVVWDTGIYDGGRRYDSASTTVKTAFNSVVTAVVLSTANRLDCWSTTAGYSIIIGGEVMTVTAMTGPTGTNPGPYTQTATVTRSVNGVSKAHVVGEQVTIAPWTGARYGL